MVFTIEPTVLHGNPAAEKAYLQDASCVVNGRGLQKLATGCHKNQVRILSLHPAQDRTDPLYGTLSLENLDDVYLHYIAVSYRWAGLPTGSICLGSARLPITTNLEDALRCFRHPARAYSFWIDAICINQDDDADKAAQVPMMGNIFNKSVQTWIWLGEGAFRDADSPFGSSVELSKKNTTTLDWFERIWVVQEVVHSHKIFIRYEDKAIGFREWLKNAGLGATDSTAQEDSMPPRVAFLRTGAVPDFWLRLPALEESLRQDVMTLLDLLVSTAGFKATLPRDRIYATLSLLNPTRWNGLPITYSTTVSEEAVMIHASKKRLSVPSWVIDWTALDAAELQKLDAFARRHTSERRHMAIEGLAAEHVPHMTHRYIPPKDRRSRSFDLTADGITDMFTSLLDRDREKGWQMLEQDIEVALKMASTTRLNKLTVYGKIVGRITGAQALDPKDPTTGFYMRSFWEEIADAWKLYMQRLQTYRDRSIEAERNKLLVPLVGFCGQHGGFLSDFYGRSPAVEDLVRRKSHTGRDCVAQIDLSDSALLECVQLWVWQMECYDLIGKGHTGKNNDPNCACILDARKVSNAQVRSGAGSLAGARGFYMRLEAFCHLLAAYCDYANPAGTQSKFNPYNSGHNMRSRETLYALEGLLQPHSSRVSNTAELHSDYIRQLEQERCQNRTFFVFDDFDCGVSPAPVREGDLLCKIHGVENLCIVRKVAGQHSHYYFVGEASGYTGMAQVQHRHNSEPSQGMKLTLDDETVPITLV
ncbi:hypothetical protein H2203_001089 [Taxawa tesnikishii (nom. ined.)]|nr:hypothetical protein H2203_001089 [Dothideales sp. JES 119]